MSGRCVVRSVRCQRSVKPAVTLIEVLVVCAIVAFMLAALVPGLSGVRERGRRLICMNNLHQWGMALQFYRDDNNDYLPKEGHHGTSGVIQRGAWYNELPPYLGLLPYMDRDGVNESIKELPNLHVWICPSKGLMDAYKSHSGKNQFHYGMNQVLDGLGTAENPSRDTPGFLDESRANKFLSGRLFNKRPHTVFMFDIAPNSPAGTPRKVATMYYRDFRDRPGGKFHGDYANILFLTGAVDHCKADDLVTDRDFRHGQIIWDHPRLYWGYTPR